MSVEGLILLALFLLWPLIERLFQGARGQKRPPGPAPRTPRPGPRPGRAPSAPRPRPPMETRVPRVPPPMDEAPAVTAPTRPATAARRAAAPLGDVQLGPLGTSRRAARRSGVAKDLRHPQGLRRAVVLMTILGPCRAATPHESEPYSSPRLSRR